MKRRIGMRLPNLLALRDTSPMMEKRRIGGSALMTDECLLPCRYASPEYHLPPRRPHSREEIQPLQLVEYSNKCISPCAPSHVFNFQYPPRPQKSLSLRLPVFTASSSLPRYHSQIREKTIVHTQNCWGRISHTSFSFYFFRNASDWDSTPRHTQRASAAISRTVDRL